MALPPPTHLDAEQGQIVAVILDTDHTRLNRAIVQPGRRGAVPPALQGHFFSSLKNPLLQKTKWAISSTQPQVMKQSATLKTGKRMNSTSIMSTT